MKTIFQLRKLARRIPRRLRKAKQQMDGAGTEGGRRAALSRVVAFESQQRVINLISESRRTAKPFRDATPHKKRKEAA
jgi:hypothetical protein